jgi:hypothetical protein
MSSFELIEPHTAAYRLACEWDVDLTVAEQIIKGVLQGGQCCIRGRRLGEPPRNISQEIAASMSSSLFPHSLVPYDFKDVSIAWQDLLKHGRTLVPPMWEQTVAEAEARAAGGGALCR